MSIWQKIKYFFYNLALKRHIAKLPSVKREMINLKQAKSIGILFNATNSQDTITVTKFADSLAQEGIKIELLGFQNTKSKTPIGENLFDKNDINWFGKPIGEKTRAFQKQKVDILIGAYINECLPLEYITTTSQSKFRVGAFNNGKTESYELMINIKENNNLDYLLTQIVHFLKVINKDEKTV